MIEFVKPVIYYAAHAQGSAAVLATSDRSQLLGLRSPSRSDLEAFGRSERLSVAVLKAELSVTREQRTPAISLTYVSPLQPPHRLRGQGVEAETLSALAPVFELRACASEQDAWLAVYAQARHAHHVRAIIEDLSVAAIVIAPFDLPREQHLRYVQGSARFSHSLGPRVPSSWRQLTEQYGAAISARSEHEERYTRNMALLFARDSPLEPLVSEALHAVQHAHDENTVSNLALQYGCALDALADGHYETGRIFRASARQASSDRR